MSFRNAKKRQIYPIRFSRLERDTVHHHSKVNFPLEIDLETFAKPDTERNFEKLIEIMKMDHAKRTQNEIHIIMRYLNETEIMNKFKLDKEISDLSFGNLMYMCSAHLNLIQIEKNEILFRIDDIGDKFFILLKGTVAVLKPVENANVKMSTEGYFNHLSILRSKGEKYLLNKTIRANLEILNIKDILEFEKVFSYMLKKKFNTHPELFNSLEDIEKIFKMFNKKFEDFDINVEEINRLIEKDKACESEFLVKYLAKKLRISTDEIMFFNKYMDLPKKDEKEVITYTYQKFMYLHAGQYFGDFALDKLNKKRTATIRAEDDCIIGYLSNDVYEEYIKAEKQKIKTKEMSFLNDNFFLYPIKPYYFEIKYFSHFAAHQYSRGQNLYSEGKAADRIILVKEGQIETSFYGSLIDLHNLIRQMIARYFNFLNETSNYSLNVDKKDLAYFKKFLHDESITKLRNKSQKYIKNISAKRNIHISLISSKDMCGIEDICLGYLTHFGKATVSTEKAKVYYLNVEKLKYIFENEKNCIMPYFKFANSKIVSLIKRLYHIKNTLTKMHLKHSKENFEDDLNTAAGFTLNNSFSGAELKHPDSMKILKHELNLSGFRNDKSLGEVLNRSGDFSVNNLDERMNRFNSTTPIKNLRLTDKNISKSLKQSKKLNLKHALKKSLDPSENPQVGENKENIENNILSNLKLRKDEKLLYDSNLMDKIKESMKKFNSQSIVVNSKSNDKHFFNLPNTKGSLFLTGNGAEKEIKEKKEEDNSDRSNASNFLNKEHSIKNDINTLQVRFSRRNRTNNIYHNTKVSFLNLFDYDNYSHYEGNKTHLNSNFNKTSPEKNNLDKMLKKTFLSSSLKSIHNPRTQPIYNKEVKLKKEYHNSESLTANPSSSTMLPFVTKYKLVNESKMKKSKKQNFIDNFQAVTNMVNTFHYNLNKSKLRYTVRSVKHYHELQKQRGYAKHLTPSNSLIKIKINTQL